MKQILQYCILTLLVFLGACADEGPFELGQFDIQLEATEVTATTAVITVKVPASKKQLLKDVTDLDILTSTGAHAQGTAVLKDYSSSATEKTFQLYNLDPSTSYKVSVSSRADLGQETNDIRYQPSYQFKTAEPNDYSAFGLKASYELVRKIGERVWITIKLPEGLKTKRYGSDTKLLISESSEMTDPQEISVEDKSESELSASFDIANDECKYYLKLKGSFDYTLNKSNNVTVNLTDFSVDFDKPFEITDQPTVGDVSATLLMTKKNSANDKVAAWIKFSLGAGMSFIGEEYTVTWSENTTFDENAPSSKFTATGHSGVAICDNLETGKSYYFKIEGSLRFIITDKHEEEYIGNVSISTANPLEIVEKGNSLLTSELLLATPDLTAIKVMLPDDITFGYGTHTLYYRASDAPVVTELPSVSIKESLAGEKEAVFTLPGLEAGKSYNLCIDGSFRLNSLGEEEETITLDFLQPVEISYTESVYPSSELLLATDNMATVKIILPEAVHFGPDSHTLYWRNANNLVEDWQSMTIDDWLQGNQEITVKIPGLSLDNSYSLRIQGSFRFDVLGDVNTTTSLDFSRPLEIKNTTTLSPTCELLLATDQLAGIKITLPEGITFSSGSYIVSYRNADNLVENWQDMTLEGYLNGKNNVIVRIPDLKANASYSIRISGSFMFDILNEEQSATLTASKSLLIIADKGLTPPTFTLVMATKDQTKITIKLADGITFGNGEHKIYWRDAAGNAVQQLESSVIADRLYGSEATVTLPGLEFNKNYYFGISGAFRFSVLEWDNDVTATLNADQPLQIIDSASSLTPPTCELVIATESNTTVRFKLSDGVTFGAGTHTIYWRDGDNAVQPLESLQIEDSWEGRNEVKVSIPGLKPGKQYYLSMEGNYRKEIESTLETIFANLSITQPLVIQESSIPTATAMLEFYYGNEAVINFQLSEGLSLADPGKIIISTAPDFSGETAEANYSYDSRFPTKLRVNLESLNPAETYFFKLKGGFIKTENGNSNYLHDETISVSGSIKLAGSDKSVTPGACEFITSGDNFAVVKLTAPDKLSFGRFGYSGRTDAYYNESEQFGWEDGTTTHNEASYKGPEAIGNFPGLEVGKKYYFMTRGTITYDNEFIFENVILPISGSVTKPAIDTYQASFETVFDYKDFTALKLIMPSGINFGNYYNDIDLKYGPGSDESLRVNSQTMLFNSLPSSTYSLSVAGTAYYRSDICSSLSLSRIQMNIAQPFTPQPEEKYLINIDQLKIGSEERISLTCNEIAKFMTNSNAEATIIESESNKRKLIERKPGENTWTFAIPNDYNMTVGKEYTLKYTIHIEFKDQSKYGDANYYISDSRTFVYQGESSVNNRTAASRKSSVRR